MHCSNARWARMLSCDAATHAQTQTHTRRRCTVTQRAHAHAHASSVHSSARRHTQHDGRRPHLHHDDARLLSRVAARHHEQVCERGVDERQVHRRRLPRQHLAHGHVDAQGRLALHACVGAGLARAHLHPVARLGARSTQRRHREVCLGEQADELQHQLEHNCTRATTTRRQRDVTEAPWRPRSGHSRSTSTASYTRAPACTQVSPGQSSCSMGAVCTWDVSRVQFSVPFLMRLNTDAMTPTHSAQ
jgi:hypothetical protein